MIRRTLLCLLLALGCSKNAGSPVITAFTATPSTIHSGQSTVLAWEVSGASQLSIDNGVGVQTGHQATVSPTQTTTYTLTATGLGGDTTAQALVTVLPALPKPVISDFHASPSDVAVGSTTTLSWTVTADPAGGALTLSIDQSVGDVTGKTSKSGVVVSADTVFTLTAKNDGGTVTRTAAVTTHPPGLQFTYTDPTAAGKLVLVKNATASTSNTIVLDMKVGATDVTAFGFAMNIPLNATGATMIALGTSTAIAGIDATGAINVGSSPATATAMIGAASSLLPNVLSIGVAKNKAAAGSSGDDTWAAGSKLFSIVLQLGATAAAGNTIFDHTAVSTDSKYKAAAIGHDGSTVVATADVAIGDLIISQ